MALNTKWTVGVDSFNGVRLSFVVDLDILGLLFDLFFMFLLYVIILSLHVELNRHL